MSFYLFFGQLKQNEISTLKLFRTLLKNNQTRYEDPSRTVVFINFNDSKITMTIMAIA